jgi:hypothetical protein
MRGSAMTVGDAIDGGTPLEHTTVSYLGEQLQRSVA